MRGVDDRLENLLALEAASQGREIRTDAFAALAQLAEQSTWVRPRAGSQLVFAGAAQPNVFVVVDGALEARRPGDPTANVEPLGARTGSAATAEVPAVNAARSAA